MASPELVLGYWDIRGLAEPIRMLLCHLEVPFEDKFYVLRTQPEIDRSDWTDVKETLGLDFPNLPYLLDGDFKLTESKAILKYICEKFRPEYLGQGLEEQTRVEEISSLLETVVWEVFPVCYKENIKAEIAAMLERIRQPLQRIGRVLERSKFLVGKQTTYPDFVFFELLQLISQMEPGFLTSISSNFLSFQAHVRSLAHIVQFEHRHTPRLFFNNHQAIFNVAVL